MRLYQAKLRRYHKMATRIQCAWRMYTAKATLMVMMVVVSAVMVAVMMVVMLVVMLAVIT